MIQTEKPCARLQASHGRRFGGAWLTEIQLRFLEVKIRSEGSRDRVPTAHWITMTSRGPFRFMVGSTGRLPMLLPPDNGTYNAVVATPSLRQAVAATLSPAFLALVTMSCTGHGVDGRGGQGRGSLYGKGRACGGNTIMRDC